MRRILLAGAAVVALAALLPVGASALVPPGHGRDHGTTLRRDLGERLLWARQFRPLGARLASGSVTLQGTVYAYDGGVRDGATVQWWAPDATDTWHMGMTTTAADGTYTLAADPADGRGELYADPSDSSSLAFLAETWTPPGPLVRDFRPGRVAVTAWRGGPWDGFDTLTTRLWGPARYSAGWTDVDGSDPASALVDVLEGSYTHGTAKFWMDEGIEFTAPFDVTAGAQEHSVTLYQADAQRILVQAPYWASGKPGSSVKVRCEHYPAGWLDSVWGYNEFPVTAPVKYFGTRTAMGAEVEYRTVRVPATVKPGYWYLIGLQHENGLAALYLETPFQVCTLKASRTVITRGTAIRVSGVVPVAGHWGTTPGIRKAVTLYAHKGTASVPRTWDPTGSGWVKVGSVMTDRYGAYRTPLFKPLRTLTLVVRYPGDQWYWRAYTSVRKITVK